MDISGLGPLDWILEILVDLVDEFFRVSCSLFYLLELQTIKCTIKEKAFP